MGLAEIRALPSADFHDRRSFPRSKGVYVVLDGEEVVYVGMTGRTFAKRWCGHHRTQDVEQGCASPEIFFLSLDLTNEEILTAEVALIQKHKPRLNKAPSLLQREGVVLLNTKEARAVEERLSRLTPMQLTPFGMHPPLWGMFTRGERIKFALGIGLMELEQASRAC
jgi:hypothetical protein